jgi:hypothetical protein
MYEREREVERERERERDVMVNVFVFSAVDHEFFYWSGLNQTM